MKLYDIKSREQRAISVQLDSKIDNGQAVHKVTRSVMRLERTSGKLRPFVETQEFAQVLRWSKKSTIVGLPESVLKNPVVASYIKSRRLVVVREYDSSENKVAVKAKPKQPVEPVRRKRGRRTKA